MLRCGDGSYYTGIARDLSRRLDEHRDGRKGAKYLRGRGPLTLLCHWPVPSRAEATRIELRIKGLSRESKTRLVRAPRTLTDVIGEPRGGA